MRLNKGNEATRRCCAIIIFLSSLLFFSVVPSRGKEVGAHVFIGEVEVMEGRLTDAW